jgi:hypothetical protein
MGRFIRERSGMQQRSLPSPLRVCSPQRRLGRLASPGRTPTKGAVSLGGLFHCGDRDFNVTCSGLPCTDLPRLNSPRPTSPATDSASAKTLPARLLR